MTSTPSTDRLVELRVLDGPNLYFPRPAIKLTLDATHLLELDEGAASDCAERLGLRGRARPAATGTEQRRRWAVRLLAHLARRLGREAGVSLAVRARPGPAAGQVVVVYPWRHLDRAEALGRALAGLLDAIDADDAIDLLSAAAREVAATPRGPGPQLPTPTVPTVAITGTNGKTTTTRLIAHIGRCAGLCVGWSSTDGIYLDGELVEAGDWSGFGGTGRVLQQPGLELAVIETARGGIILRGLGVSRLDVAVVTNVANDHLGLHGVETLDQLAEVKAAIVRIVKPVGWSVLNAEDPRVLAMGSPAHGRPFTFSVDPDAPGLRWALEAHGRAATVIDGDVVVLDASGDADHLIATVDVPVTFAGISTPNLSNALAGAAAGLALGLEREAVITGLRTFLPDPALNPGRNNVWELGGATVIVDLAHNEDSLRALLEIVHGLRPPGGLIRLAVGTAGDRGDDVLVLLGEMAARGADRIVICHKEGYLRGRTMEEMAALFRSGARDAGVDDVVDFPTELASLQALVAEAQPGDVVAVMCHADFWDLAGWLDAQGAVVVGPDGIRERVLAAEAGAAQVGRGSPSRSGSPTKR